MKPSRTDEDAFVDLLDVLLRDGVVVEADVIVSVAEIPLIGVKLRAAVAGMKTMTDYGMFESFDRDHRARAIDGDARREEPSEVDAELATEALVQEEAPAQQVGLAAARWDAAADATDGEDRSGDRSGDDGPRSAGTDSERDADEGDAGGE